MNSGPANLDGFQFVRANRKMGRPHLWCVEEHCHRFFVSAAIRLWLAWLPAYSNDLGNYRLICLIAEFKGTCQFGIAVASHEVTHFVDLLYHLTNYVSLGLLLLLMLCELYTIFIVF